MKSKHCKIPGLKLPQAQGRQDHAWIWARRFSGAGDTQVVKRGAPLPQEGRQVSGLHPIVPPGQDQRGWEQ